MWKNVASESSWFKMLELYGSYIDESNLSHEEFESDNYHEDLEVF